MSRYKRLNVEGDKLVERPYVPQCRLCDDHGCTERSPDGNAAKDLGNATPCVCAAGDAFIRQAGSYARQGPENSWPGKKGA